MRIAVWRSFGVAALFALVSARTACAQTTAPTSKWELEGYGGLPIVSFGAGGSTSLPAPGPSIQTASFQFPSRLTPSWFFGDGASMLNSASAELGLASAITPLDSVLSASGVKSRQFHGGVRVRRTLTARYAAEFSVDLGRGPRDLSGDLDEAIVAARDSFKSAFSGLLASGPFTGIVVDATSATSKGSGLEVAVTGALNISFKQRGRFVPYATIGGGVLTHQGDLPSASLTGDYRASILSSVPIHETDRVTVRVARSSDTSPVLIFGGGVRHDQSSTWGWRFDARVLASTGNRVILDASPLIAQGTPAGFIESLTNPNLQISNSASTGRVSTLGGQLSEFEAFHEAVRFQLMLTVGIVRRF